MKNLELKYSYLPDSFLNISRHVKTERAVSMILLIVILYLLSACKPDYLSKSELDEYIHDPENGLLQVQTFKDYEVSVAYRPNDLLILQETGGATAIGTNELKSITNKYEDYYYFILSLSKGDKEALYRTGGDYGQFSDLVQTLSFRMASHVNMTTSGKDTIEVADYVFPRTYGMGGATSLMFVFNKKEAEGDEWVQFNLKEFGLGLGNQNFRFRKEDLDDTPKIKFAGT